MEIILGSQSPRRKEILSFFSLPFRQISPDFDETTVPFHGDPAAFATEVARQKALALAKKYPYDLILTADTVVYRDGKLYQKPETMAEANAMLKELSGKKHQVHSGVSVIKESQEFSGSELSEVEFHQLTEDQIRIYHSHFAPLDKAGAYAIQKGGCLIVKRIEGCYYNIMGLPLQTATLLLKKAGIDLWNYLKSV